MENTIVISLEGISNKNELHNLLKSALPLSEYYGNNLDALQDELSELSYPLSVTLTDLDLADPSMTSYINNMVTVFEDCTSDNSLINFSVKVKPAVTSRKEIAVCGVWEDGENLNYFLRSIQTEALLEEYYVACYTFQKYIPEIHDNTDIGSNLLDIVKKNKPAALIIFSEMIKNPAIINGLISYGKKVCIPVFVLEHEYDSCINLKLEYKKSFRRIIEHVINEHGCRNIEMMAGVPGNAFSEERIQAYKDVLDEHNIHYDDSKIHYGDFWGHPAKNCMNKLFDNGYKVPDAIICANDSMAVGVTEVLAERGYNVPKDCIVTGFDGIWQARYNNPTITTAVADYRSVADLILKTVNDWKPENNFYTQVYDLEFKLLPSQSCGCVDNTIEDWTRIVKELSVSNKDYYYHTMGMGTFLTRTIGMDSPAMACSMIEPHLWQWRDQYYLIALNSDKCTDVPFIGNMKDNYYNNKFFNLKRSIPDCNEVTCKESDFNIFFFADISSSNESFGYVCVGCDKPELRKQQRFEEFRSYVSGVTHSVIRNEELISANAEIEKLSRMDYLTGLQNRRGFFKVINQELKSDSNAGKYFTLFSIDMDSLKSINDTYGHQEGDIAIKVLADAISECSQGYTRSVGARYGGDEFAMFIIDNQPMAVKSEALRERIETVAMRDFRVKNKPYAIKASIGAADCLIDSAFDIESLLHKSDETMYLDKENRKKNGV